MKSAAKFIALFLVFALFIQLLPAYALDDLTPSQDESSDTDLLTENDSYSAFFERVQHENYLDLSSDVSAGNFQPYCAGRKRPILAGKPGANPMLCANNPD